MIKKRIIFPKYGIYSGIMFIILSLIWLFTKKNVEFNLLYSIKMIFFIGPFFFLLGASLSNVITYFIKRSLLRNNIFIWMSFAFLLGLVDFIWALTIDGGILSKAIVIISCSLNKYFCGWGGFSLFYIVPIAYMVISVILYYIIKKKKNIFFLALLIIFSISPHSYAYSVDSEENSHVHQHITREAKDVWDDIPPEIELHLTNPSDAHLDVGGYDLGDRQ